MPPVSERQRKAMFAAAEGRSTLGIPKSVGEEFVSKDELPQAAGVVFASPRGRVLLLHRAPEETNYGGYWGLPGGGAEAGETPEQAARREANEETGYEHAGRLKALDRVKTPTGMIFTTFAAPVAEEFAPEMADGEHTGFTWADLQHLPQPLHPSVARVLGEHIGVTGDMTPEDWSGLTQGFLKWLAEEEREGEHAEDESEEAKEHARGKLTEKEREEADRTPKEREDMPESAFLEPGARKYPVKAKRNGEWAYSRDLLLAAAREARMHDHADLASRADAIRNREFGVAQDGARIAFDRESIRSYDADGRLHVEKTPISKANICEYWGREIPGAEQMGLQPDRKYRLLRHPDELRKAVDTFNNLPLLRRHVAVSAGDHKPEDVVGSTGTDASFDAPYLMNSLVVWSKDDIDDIERDLKKELSSAYRYRADMTPGSYEGEPYDGVMRDIVGNHVALVKEGRAGPDVVVGDSAISREKDCTMAHAKALSRQALLASGALLAYLPGKLAADAKLDDFRPLLADVTARNWKASQPKIIAGVTEMMKGKLAQDAKLDTLPALLLALDEVEDLPEPGGGKGKGPAGDRKAKDKKAMDRKARDEAREELKESLKDKLTAEDWKAACDDIDGLEANDEETDEERKEREEKEAEDRKARDEEMKEETKKAMDEAIAGERQRQRDIREAERFVRPWVGDLAIAYDSADDVYKAAIEARGKSTKGIHPSAYRTILEMLPKPGTESRPSAHRVAMDSAGTKTFGEMFPGAMDIRINA